MPHILIIEPQISGHHFRYLQWISTSACEAGWTVTIATDYRHSNQPFLQKLITTHPKTLRLHYEDFSGVHKKNNLLGLIKNEIYYWKKIKNIFSILSQDLKIDHILIPYADICLYALAIKPAPFGNKTWSAISMRPSFHCHKMGLTERKGGLLETIKEKLFLRLARSTSVKKLILIDPCLAAYVNKRQPASRIIYLQDPVDIDTPLLAKTKARALLGLDAQCRIILLFGSIDWRKGIRELLEAQLSLPPADQPTILVAGRQAPDVSDWLAADQWQDLILRGRLKFLNRFITEEEESQLFCACDTVWLGYREHLGSSGVLWQAVAFERPIIGADDGLIGWFVRTKNLGVTVPISDKDAVRTALLSLPTTFKSNSGLTPLSGKAFAEQLLKAII